jgi:hypothetical protein
MWQPGFRSQEHHDEDAYERFGEKFADAQYEILEVKNLKFEHWLRTAARNHGIIIRNTQLSDSDFKAWLSADFVDRGAQFYAVQQTYSSHQTSQAESCQARIPTPPSFGSDCLKVRVQEFLRRTCQELANPLRFVPNSTHRVRYFSCGNIRIRKFSDLLGRLVVSFLAKVGLV